MMTIRELPYSNDRNYVYSKLALLILLCGTIVSVFQTTAIAQNKQGDEAIKINSVSKQIQGEVVWKSKSKLSVVHYSDDLSEREILFLLDDAVRVVYKRTLDDIQVGDTVRVSYNEYTVEEGGRTLIKTKPTEVAFIRSGTRLPPVAQTPVETDILSSE